MSRIGVPIPMRLFKPKIEELILHDEFPYNLSSRIQKDLSKINFDFENCDLEEYIDGLIPVALFQAGGDWEHPVVFCLYWDGKQLRGYIPKDGNVYNEKEKCAYGSEEDDSNCLPAEQFEKLKFDYDKIRADIANRIKIKL